MAEHAVADTDRVDGRRSTQQLRPAVVPTSRGDLHHLDVVVDGTSVQVIAGRTGVTILSRTWPDDRPSPLDVLRGEAADEVTWSDFRWVTGYDDDVLLDELPSPMRFDRRANERELAQAALVLPSLPSEVRRPSRRWWWRR